MVPAAPLPVARCRSTDTDLPPLTIVPLTWTVEAPAAADLAAARISCGDLDSTPLPEPEDEDDEPQPASSSTSRQPSASAQARARLWGG